MERRIGVLTSILCLSTGVLAGPGDPTIRILTAYTASAVADLPGGAANTVATQISNLNTAFTDSGVRLNAVNAGIVQVSSLPDNPTLALDAILKNYTILKARDDNNADVVMTINGTGNVGQATIGATKPSEAFAVIGTRVLGVHGYQHEFAHLLGARHQSFGAINSASNDTHPSIGKGWYVRVNLTTQSACSHTIMAYEPTTTLNGITCRSSGAALMYSNPALCEDYREFLAGCPPWGDATHNNAQVLNNNGPAITSFRATKLASLYASWLSTILFYMGLN